MRAVLMIKKMICFLETASVAQTVARAHQFKHSIYVADTGLE